MGANPYLHSPLSMLKKQSNLEKFDLKLPFTMITLRNQDLF